MKFDISDADLDKARERGLKVAASAPAATAARYDSKSGRLVIDFANGATFMVPARTLQDLEAASDEALADIRVEHGYALRWERLDVDFTIPGLMAGMFGTAAFMAGKAGQGRSRAKAAAARENGRKGGRPRKVAG